MNEARPLDSRSDRSDRVDRLGILALFWSDRINPRSDRSDLAALPAPSGPTGPTGAFERRTEKTTSNQHGPTGPTGPTENRDGAAEALALDSFEERAAIREHDGGQARAEAEAEAAALAEVATVAGMAPEALQALWAAHPDARAYLAMLTCDGPLTYGAAASLLGWGATRAWQAEARLRAARLVTMGRHGAAVPTGIGKG